MVIFLSGLGLIAYHFYKTYTSKIRNTLLEIAEKYSGKVERFSILHAPEVFFNYKGLPATISYSLGGKSNLPETFIKVQTGFPKNISLEIGQKEGIYLSMKRHGFEKNFQFKLKGREEGFLEKILTQKIKTGFMYFIRKYPNLTIKSGELEFTIADLPLDSSQLEDYYSFAFFILDHIENLLESEQATA